MEVHLISSGCLFHCGGYPVLDRAGSIIFVKDFTIGDSGLKAKLVLNRC